MTKAKQTATAASATCTVRLHRVLATSPEKIYRAFLDADAMAAPKWFTAKVHHMDPKVGGTFKMSCTNFTSGKSHAFGGEYLELVPHERIRRPSQWRPAILVGSNRSFNWRCSLSRTFRIDILSVGKTPLWPSTVPKRND